MRTEKYNLNKLDWEAMRTDMAYSKATIFVGTNNDHERWVLVDDFLEDIGLDAELVVTTPGSSRPIDSASSKSTLDWPILDELFGREHWKEFIAQRTETLRAKLDDEGE